MRKLITFLQNHLRKYFVSGQFKKRQNKNKLMNFKDFHFHRTYEIAQYIKDTLHNENVYPSINTHNPIVLKIPRKDSLLHQYITDCLLESASFDNDKVGDDIKLHEHYQKTLDIYNIKYKTLNSWKKNSYDIKYGDLCQEYSYYLWDNIEKKCLNLIVEEVFHILFGNREFLKEFNLLISEQIKLLPKKGNENVLEKDGVLIRPNSWSPWVEKAVRYRDKGRCVFCGKELSGELDPSFKKEIDHIVPLEGGGSNDITNLQYSCKSCNILKSTTPMTTKKYIPYYE